MGARFVAIVGSELETGDAIKELTPALKLLGPILEQFVIVTDSFEPTDDGKASGCFITKTYDSTSHFFSATQDCLQIFERVTGAPADLDAPPRTPGGEEANSNN